MRTTTTALERFEQRVEPEPMSGCWLWVGGGGRYGEFWLMGRNIGAHRAAWVLYRGPLRVEDMVCHSCDVPRCVNPEHLFLGTQLDNRQDAVKKGRAAKGETIGNAVLTADIVRTILVAHGNGDSPTAIAKWLGIKRVTVSAVTTRRNWRHI